MFQFNHLDFYSIITIIALNFCQKLNFFIQESVFENVVCEKVAILSRGR